MSISLCGQVGANMGQIDCDVTRGNIETIIAGSGYIAPSEYATSAAFKTAFKAKLKLASGNANKLFPFPVVQTIADKTVAAKEGSYGSGLTVKLLRSKPGYELTMIPGSALEKKMIKFDGQIIPLFIFDDNGVIWGVQDDAGNFKGANYFVGVEPRGFGDKSNPKGTVVTISLVDSRDFIENSVYYESAFSTTDFKGLLDVILSEATTHTSNAYQIAAKISTGQLGSAINLYDTYADGLAVANLWKATNDATGADIPITTVAKNTTLKCWTVTLDSTAFAALSSGAKIDISLVDAPTLDAASVTGIEGSSVQVVK